MGVIGICGVRNLSMHSTRNPKTARKSRGLEMLSDIENLDIIAIHLDNSARRPESANSNMFENNEQNLYLKYRKMGLANDADPGQNSTSANSNAELNKFSSELNSRLHREMDEMMNCVNTQIQRAISDAKSNQILPQKQNALKAGSGHVTQNRWNVPAERPEINPEDYHSEKVRNKSRNKSIRDRLNDDYTDQAYDSNANFIDKKAGNAINRCPA